MLDVRIKTNSHLYKPVVLSGLSWNTERKSSPGTVKFELMYDNELAISEGDEVTLFEDDVMFFKGYIFTLKLSSDNILAVTAYDQLRYFKNKDTRIYSSKTADELLKAIASDYSLTVGECDHAGLSISRVEEDTELFDAMNNAIAETVYSTGKLYVLYDDCGALRLRSIESMLLDLLITDESAEKFTLSSSIDSEVFNRIKLAYKDKDTGAIEYYIAQNSESISKWGLLQLYQEIDSTETARQQATAMLNQYGKAVKTFEVSGVFGDIRVRAGTSLFMQGKDKMLCLLVESAKHKWVDGIHTMDLRLKGGDL